MTAEPTSTEDALSAEFDTVAAWTQAIVTELGPEYAIPAACRGSGSHTWLRWLSTRLDLQASDRFLDAGAGLGGPAGWLREERGIRAVLAEPMWSAIAGAQALFGLPAVASWSQALPFCDASFDAGWLLGVLCTTPDHLALLQELYRVLKPGGRLGLLVLVQVGELPIQPDGNHFPTPASLTRDLDRAGFDPLANVATKSLPPPDDEWRRRTAEVEDALERRYRDHPDWETAREQGERMTLLLYGGAVETRLLVVSRRAA